MNFDGELSGVSGGPSGSGTAGNVAQWVTDTALGDSGFKIGQDVLPSSEVNFAKVNGLTFPNPNTIEAGMHLEYKTVDTLAGVLPSRTIFSGLADLTVPPIGAQGFNILFNGSAAGSPVIPADTLLTGNTLEIEIAGRLNLAIGDACQFSCLYGANTVCISEIFQAVGAAWVFKPFRLVWTIFPRGDVGPVLCSTTGTVTTEDDSGPLLWVGSNIIDTHLNSALRVNVAGTNGTVDGSIIYQTIKYYR